MQKVFYKYSKYLDFVSIKSLTKMTGCKSVFPFYHVISDDDVIHIKHLYKIRTVNDFVKDLEFLLKEYDPIDPKELITNYKNGIFNSKPGFLLTFDDGLSEFYKIIAPILLQKGIPSICFLNSDFVDNKDLFFRFKTSILIEKLIQSPISSSVKNVLKVYLSNHDMRYDDDYNFLYSITFKNRHYLDEIAGILEVDFRDYLKKYKPYLDTSEINELIRQGFLFGSHSIDHPKYLELPLEQQIFQTEQSVAKITTNFNLDYKVFSFPFTDFGLSKSLFDKLFSDKQNIIDLSFGCAGLKQDECIKNIQRIPLEVDNFTAKEIIYGEYMYYLAKGILKKNSIKRFKM